MYVSEVIHINQFAIADLLCCDRCVLQYVVFFLCFATKTCVCNELVVWIKNLV